MAMQSESNHHDPRPTALVNARLFDPASGLDQEGGVLIANGKIATLGPEIGQGSVGEATFIDCGGKLLAPGLIDMLVFTGEPGHEHRETLATASRAASAGGVTTIICMPIPIPSSTTLRWSISFCGARGTRRKSTSIRWRR